MGDGNKPEKNHPPQKDLVESLGTSHAATADKLLSDAHTAKLSTPGSVGPITANTFGMVSLTNKADLLTNSHVTHEAIKTGNSAADFVVNFADGGIRNLANIGKETLKSVANPLSTISDIGTAGKTIVENPLAVKNMATDFGSSLIGAKGAGEAGSSWGNLTTTVGMFFVGGKNAVQRAERTAVEGAGSIEAKVAQTSKVLQSAEIGTAKSAESLAARLGTGNAAEVGNVSRTLPNRLDGLGKPPVFREPVLKAPAVEPMPTVREPVIKVEPVIKSPAAEPVIKAPGEPVPTIREPVVKAEPIVREPVFKPEPVREPVLKTEPIAKPEPVKEPVVKTEPVAKPEPVKEPVAKTEPVKEPTAKPAEEPVVKPKEEPVVKPKEEPLAKPKEEPLAKPKEEPVAKPKEEPLAKPKEEPLAKPKEEPLAKPKEEPLAKPKEEPVAKPKEEPVAKPKEETVAKPKEEPVAKPKEEPVAKPKEEPGTVKDTNVKEPGKPGDTPETTFVDRNKTPKPGEPVVEPGPGKPKPGEPLVEPAKPNVKPGEPVVEPVKPGTPETTVKTPREPLPPTEPVTPAKPRTPGEPAPIDATPNNPRTYTPKPGEPVVAPKDTVPAAPRETNPVAPRETNPLAPRDNAPLSPRDNTPLKPADAPVVNPAVPKDAPHVVLPAEQPSIQNLIKHIDSLPATTPGVTDARTKLNLFNTNPTPENYRNLSDTLKTLANNTPAVHEHVQLALETARQSVLVHAVADTTQSLEKLLSSASSRISSLPPEVQGKAEGLLQQMRAASQSMVSAETVVGQQGALQQLKNNSQDLMRLLQNSKGAQSEIENALLRLSNSQKDLVTANYLLRTGDTFSGQTVDFIKNYWRNIVGSAVVVGDLRNLLNTTSQRIEAEAKKIEESRTEKAEEAHSKAASSEEHLQRSDAALFLNSKEPLGKPAAEHDTREVIRKQNLSMYGIDVDYTYYQRGPGHVVDDRPAQAQQQVVKPGFRSSSNEQDKPSAPKFDYTKTRMPATRMAVGDGPFLSGASGFRPGVKQNASGRGGASGGAGGNNDPSHASNLMSKNYAFVVGPTAAQSRYGGPSAGSEASEKQNTDRGASGGVATVAVQSPVMVASAGPVAQAQTTANEDQ